MENVERDLIFALQAVQMGLITKDVLLEAGLVWSRDREPALKELIVQRSGLDDTDVALVDDVVSRMLKRDEGDPRRTLQRLGGRERVFESFGGAYLEQEEKLASILSVGAPGDDSEEMLPGERVTRQQSGRYTVKGEHGRGGIGRVLVAHDEHVGREIAIKELIPEQQGEPGNSPGQPAAAVAARFMREARVTGQLEHPNIVPVYEVGRRDDGTLYYTMKLVRGKNLAEALRECRDLDARLRLLPHYVDLCNAIGYAHSRGVIHRDIKTDNVMLGEFGETVVLDWGLAKVRGEQDIGVRELERGIRLYQEVEAGKTVDGRAIGTPAYMSPEQADGRVEDIDERSDLWSLGAVLYELLTGRPPFEGVNAFEIIGKVLADPITPPGALDPEIPPELASVCEKALQRDKDARYQKASGLAAEVEAYQSGARVRAYEYSSWELLKRFVGRNKALSGAVVLLLILLLVGSATIYSQYRKAEVARVNEAKARIRAEEARGKAERSLEAERVARVAARVASRQLAWAYQATAEREIARKDYMSAKIFAAAALKYDPDHPRSPLYPVGDTPVSAEGQSRLINVQSILYTVAIKNLVARRGVLRAKEGGAVYAVAFAPDGLRLATGGADGDVRVWDRRTRTLSGSPLRGHRKLVTSVAFSPDGRLLASAGNDLTIMLWDVQHGRPIAFLAGHTEPVLGLAFSPDGRLLASVSKDRTVRLWDMTTRKLHKVYTRHEETVFAVAFSPKGDLIATAGSDRTVRVWRHKDLQEVALLKGHDGSVFSLAFLPDGRHLASAGEDQTVRLWSVVSGRNLATLRGHRQLVRAVTCSPDGRLLASASFDKTVRVWSVAERRVVATLRGHPTRVFAVAFSPKGDLVASAGRDRTTRLWGIAVRPIVATLSGHRDLVEALAVSPDGRLLVSGSYDRTVRVWDLVGRRPLRLLKGHRKAVLAVSLNAKAGLIASGSRDRTVILWRAATGTRLMTLVGHEGDINSVAFSPDGAMLATASADRTVRLWDSRSGRLRARMKGHRDEVYGVAFSPQGNLLASTSFDGTIRLWDPTRGGLVGVLTGGRGYAFRVAFSPNGKTLAAARQLTEKDSEIELWDVASRRVVRRFKGHLGLVHALAFSPDGRMLLSGGKDQTVRLWEVSSGRLAQILRHARPVTAATFTPDGQSMIVNDWKAIKVYPVQSPVWTRDPEALLRRAEREAGLRLKAFTLRPTEDL